MDGNKTPIQILELRRRNQIIEYFKTMASAENQRKYEQNVPIANVPGEMIDDWDSYAGREDWGSFHEEIFTPGEISAIRRYHKACKDTLPQLPNPIMGSVEDYIGTPSWDFLMSSAQDALETFRLRGILDEDSLNNDFMPK